MSSNDAQIDYWNGRAGGTWAAMQKALDAMLAPVTSELTKRVGAVASKRVLDIGCGTGETCAIWLSGGASVTGVDISQPMLAVAANRVQGKATLIEADASRWMGDAPFDLAVSRFGVMFFADPFTAFANIARNIRPDGRMVFACWRAASENPWATTPIGAVRDLVPEAPPPVPHAPGPFGLADKERLRTILDGAGFVDVTIEPFDCDATLASEGGVDTAVSFVMHVGPAGAALAEANEETRATAARRLRDALAPFEKDGRVALGGAVWMVEARRSA